MAHSFRVGDSLSPAVVREFNLGEWRKGPAYYFGTTPEWHRPAAEVLRGIDHPTYDVQAMIDAVPAYPATDAGLRASWAHHMAIHAGCHAWPNANHRTAMLAFNFASAAALTKVVGFTQPSRGEALVDESHAQRDKDGGEYAVRELSNPAHAYRRLFDRYAKELTIVGDKEAGKLARFGPR